MLSARFTLGEEHESPSGNMLVPLFTTATECRIVDVSIERAGCTGVQGG